MKKEVRKCAVCGKKFTPKTANALTCSEKCYKVRRAELDKKRRLPKSAEKTEAKEPKKLNAVEKITLPKKAVKKACEAKKCRKAACKRTHRFEPKLDTIVKIKAGNDFKVIALCFYIALKAVNKLITENRIKPI